MTAAKTVFVTGGTGFLGSFFISSLLRKGYHVIALVRGPEPRARLLEVLGEVYEGMDTEAPVSRQLTVVEGDVRVPGCGLTEALQQRLAEEVGEIWHCATTFKFQERCREEITSHNVTGTHHVLDFARRCNTHQETPMFYVSTAYAAPVAAGVARETLAPVDTPTRNLYEWSKRAAEHLVGQFRQEHGLPAIVLRPSIIVGHCKTGRATRFTGYYDVIRAIYLLTHSLEVNLGTHFDRNLRLRILARPNVLLNLVPVDYVVEAMWRVAQAERQEAWIFHLVNELGAPLAELFRQACEPLGVTGIELVEAEAFQHRPMSGLERLFNRKTQFQAPYLLDGPGFEVTNFRRAVPRDVLPCPRMEADVVDRVNRYYYREVLDRQFGASRTVPAPVFSPEMAQAESLSAA
jgi:nucleoside-diphosphate-sugar epimerase